MKPFYRSLSSDLQNARHLRVLRLAAFLIVIVAVIVGLVGPSTVDTQATSRSTELRGAFEGNNRLPTNLNVPQEPWRELTQELPSQIKSWKRVGMRVLTETQSVVVALRLPNQAALETFVQQVNDPQSPMYHRFLTTEEFTEGFAPPMADYATVVAHLESNGLKIVENARNRLWVKASGSVAQVQQAFDTTIAVYQDGQKLYYANQTPPRLPRPIAALTDHVYGLDNIPRFHPKHLMTRSILASPPYNANQIRAAYNLNPFYNAGNRGRGKTIAIFSSFSTTQNDISRYINDWVRTMPSTPPNYVADITYVNVDGGPTRGDTEADLDLELALSTAPDARILFYQGPYTGSGEFETLARIVSDNQADIVSYSYGNVEGRGEVFFEHDLLLAAAAQGITFFCSSGDSGAAGEINGRLSVDFPASDPNVIAVGGTTLALDTANQITSEVGWNGSGGGFSGLYSAPAWQANASFSDRNPFLGIANPVNVRLVPDVSLNADPDTGYLIYSGNSSLGVGGTSASCPMWAAATALIELHIDRVYGPSRQGNINARFYQLLSTAIYNNFLDITQGNNQQPGIGGYFCKGGYDLVTGLGSVNFFALAGGLIGENLFVDGAYVGVELGTPLQPYRTVMNAVNAASSAKRTNIHIRANSYLEDLAINKYITLFKWDSTGIVRIGYP